MCADDSERAGLQRDAALRRHLEGMVVRASERLGCRCYFFIFIAEGSQVVTWATSIPLRVSKASEPL